MEGGFLVVDVRAPVEFAEGHMPGAINKPLLDNEQRALVGVTYKEEGAARARLAAMDAVVPGLTAYLRDLASLTGAGHGGRRPAIMCSRGGERSRNVVLLLALIGVHAVRVEGGYKAYRRDVVSGLEDWTPPVRVITLFGLTGAGKSALLRALREASSTFDGPHPWPVDLEELALHRGSLLGGMNQPGRRNQKDFDSLVWDEIRLARGDYLVIEGEGRKIGHLVLPKSVARAVSDGSPVLVSAPVETRVKRIMGEYDPKNWTAEDVAGFRRSVGLMAPRLRRETVVSLETAFDDGRFTDVVRELLVRYYDPLYQRSCVDGRRFVLEIETSSDPHQDAVSFMGSMAQVIKEVSSEFPS